MNSIELEKQFDFLSQQWAILKKFLLTDEAQKISQLLGESDPHKSDELKGQIKYIRSLLKIEEAAQMSRLSRT